MNERTKFKSILTDSVSNYEENVANEPNQEFKEQSISILEEALNKSYEKALASGDSASIVMEIRDNCDNIKSIYRMFK